MKSQAKEALPVKAQRGERFAATNGSVARFKIQGTFIGGCAWESNETFDDRGYAEATAAIWEKEAICKSKNVRVVEVPLNG